MSDPSSTPRESDRPDFDMAAMVDMLSGLDDDELAEIEDDLDFWHFTGCASPRLRGLLAVATRRTVSKAA